MCVCVCVCARTGVHVRVLLEAESNASRLLGKHSTTELCPLSIVWFLIVEKEFNLVAQTDFKLTIAQSGLETPD